MPCDVAFTPAPWLRGPHRQTMWANYAPRGAVGANLQAASTSTVIDTVDGDRLRLHWGPRAAPGAPVLIALHGLTGCAGSRQVLGIAGKAWRRGFEVVRVDLRNATGGSPSVGIGHAGRSEDLRTVLDHVLARRPDAPVAIVGYSLGGNVALKAAGEYAGSVPSSLRAVAAISVPIDLAAACRMIDSRANWHYRTYFVRRLKRLLDTRSIRVPRYAGLDLSEVRSLRAFDDVVVAPLCGFRDASDYYARSSAQRVLHRVRVPTLLIQAVDDPFIPFTAYEDQRVRGNPALRLLAPSHGGHTGFFGRGAVADEDLFWADNRAVEFCAEAVAPGCALTPEAFA